MALTLTGEERRAATTRSPRERPGLRARGEAEGRFDALAARILSPHAARNPPKPSATPAEYGHQDPHQRIVPSHEGAGGTDRG